MKDLFSMFKTPILLSAAMERIFSPGKDVLKPERAGLSEKHFEILFFPERKIILLLMMGFTQNVFRYMLGLIIVDLVLIFVAFYFYLCL